MAKVYPVLTLVAMALFAVAPANVAMTPVEATMGLVQKIFYYHVPAAMTMFVSAFVCGIASAIFLFKGRARADRFAEKRQRLTGQAGGDGGGIYTNGYALLQQTDLADNRSGDGGNGAYGSRARGTSRTSRRCSGSPTP